MAGVGLIALLVILLLGQTRFAVLFNEQTGEFTSALAAQDEDRFWNSIKLCLGLLAAAIPITPSIFSFATRWASTGGAG